MTSEARRADVVRVDRRQLLEHARKALAGLSVLVVNVDQIGREVEESPGVDPVSLGRELLLALPRLVAAGELESGALVEAVRREVVETAPGATSDEVLEATLDGLGKADALDQLVHTCEQEVLLAQLAQYVEGWRARLRRAGEQGETTGGPRDLEEDRFMAVERAPLVERLLGIRAPLGALVAELDLAERSAGGFGDVEPITLGRWLLGALVRLVHDGAVTTEQLARSLGRRGSGEADAERAMRARLEAVRSAEAFGVLMREVDLAVVVAQMAFDEAKCLWPMLRSRQLREAGTEELNRSLAEEAAQRRESDDAS